MMEDESKDGGNRIVKERDRQREDSNRREYKSEDTCVGKG